MDLLDWKRTEFSITAQAELLGLSRTSLYYHPHSPRPEDVEIMHMLDGIYTQYPFYGSRRLKEVLSARGFKVNRKRIQKYMGIMGIEGIHPGSNLSKRDLKGRIFPYLLRNRLIAYPNQVWGIDITYIKLKNDWMYLVPIIDWYSRFLIAWELDQTLENTFVLEAVNRALSTARPEIFNSDQGSNFTSPRYIELLRKNCIAISMDGKGRAIDNVFTERFFRSLKYEEVYPKEYGTPREAMNSIREYMRFYNHERPHQSLEYRTPAQLYYNN